MCIITAILLSCVIVFSLPMTVIYQKIITPIESSATEGNGTSAFSEFTESKNNADLTNLSQFDKIDSNDFQGGKSVINDQKQGQQVGKNGSQIIISQGIFSDLEIIYCNTNYNPCTGTDEKNYMKGDDGDNIMVGMKGDDNLTANAGNDEIWGNDGKDTIHGGDGNDQIAGEDGTDILRGDWNDDIIVGGEGNDYIYGGENDDIISGDKGTDTIFGGSGNDKIFHNSRYSASNSIADGSRDRIYCGDGNDEVWINLFDRDIWINCEVIHKGSGVSKR